MSMPGMYPEQWNSRVEDIGRNIAEENQHKEARMDRILEILEIMLQQQTEFLAAATARLPQAAPPASSGQK